MDGEDRSVLARVFTVSGGIEGSCKRPECGDMHTANEKGESCVQVAPVLWGDQPIIGQVCDGLSPACRSIGVRT
jgi:hypothetical protein